MSKLGWIKCLLAGLVVGGWLAFACTFYRQTRQAAFDHTLITALRRLDSRTALQALEEGADANAREWPHPPRSFWQRLLSGFTHSPALSQAQAPSALFVAIDWRWRDVPVIGHWRTTGYTPVNAPPQDPKVIAALLEHGADVHVTNEIGMTPLHVAAWQGKSETVRLLLEHGAELNKMYGPTKLRTFMGTPLHFAIASDDVPTVRVLLRHHADINTLRDQEGFTALNMAQVRNENNHVVTRLLRAALQQQHPLY